MGFAILRCEKIKSAGGIATAAAHLLRERDTPNADPERRHLNKVVGAQAVDAAMADWRAQLDQVDRKIRKDAVVGLEYVFAYSPGAIPDEKADAYFARCFQWLEARHGNARIVMAAAHYDETTPHMHAIVVPLREKVLKTGRSVTALDAKHWMDGSAKLSKMQSDFAEAVGRPMGLERGIQGSQARHERVKRLYGALERPRLELPPLPEKGLLESPAAYRNRVTAVVTEKSAAVFGRMNALIREKEEAAEAGRAKAERLADELRTRPTRKDLDESRREARELHEILTMGSREEIEAYRSRYGRGSADRGR